MIKQNSTKEQSIIKYLIKKIDVYGQSLEWYIGNNEKYQTITGGIKTLIIFSISFLFLLYSIIKFFTDRNGSFVMYDIKYSELSDANFNYFKDFEIFFFLRSSSSMIEIDNNIFQAYLIQINATDNSYIFSYPFDVCDNDYFIDQLGFSKSIKSNLEKTYCINRENYPKLPHFLLSQPSTFGEKINAVHFILLPNCSNISSCTNEEISNFQNVFQSIYEIKIFIKSYIPNPLNKENPEQKEITSLTLNSNYKGAIVYFKNYNISTQSSIIPYLFDKEKKNILAYDYYTEDYDNSDNKTSQNSYTYYLEFALSNKISFLDRDYDQLNTLLGGFIGVFNSLQGIGKIFTLLFDSFSKEFFIFNFIIKNRLFVKKNKMIFISNPPKITQTSNDDLSSQNKEKDLLNVNNNTKNNLYQKDNLTLKSKINLFDKESKDEMIINNNNKIIKKKNENENESEIKMNMFKSLWCSILMSLEIENSKYPDIQNALNKIKLIQEIFDTSIYISLIFDMMRLKKVIFNQQQLKLFESIHFTFDEINDYLHKFAFCEDINNNDIIYQNIQKTKQYKNSKMTENIINVLKKQINI